VPSQIGACLIPLLRQQGHPYAVEVVGDPWDVFAAGASTHPLRPIFRRVFAHRLRQQCQYACAAAYVTEFVLQKRYPPAPGAFTTHYSSIELPPEAFADQPREPRPATQRRRIISVGSLDQMYKAPDVLIDAVAQCVQQGLDLELVWIGDGKHRVEMEQRARDRGLPLGDRMHFLGQLPAGPAIRDELDQADIFVLASRTEGLPRVIIEAMARGLPCVGSNVGGIPELLPPMRLFQPNDVVTLRNILWNVLGDREALSQMSNQNLQKARAYSSHVLNERRRTFYEEVLNASFAK
jgi:glycosyltransferase involved in cell wall biosynthesis